MPLHQYWHRPDRPPGGVSTCDGRRPAGQPAEGADRCL